MRWWLGLSFGDAIKQLADSLGICDEGGPGNSIDGTPVAPRSTSTLPYRRPAADAVDIDRMTQFAKEAHRRLTGLVLRRLAESLGVTCDALRSLRVGLTSDGRCSTWPMRDASWRVIGVRLATLPWGQADAAKWSYPRSHSGLFLARGMRIRRRLFVTEGASDTASAIGMGLSAVGRPNCASSSEMLFQFIDQQRPQRVTVVADHDPPGLEGASRLVAALRRRSIDADFLVPPLYLMDLRAWCNSGADRDAVYLAPTRTIRLGPVQTSFQFLNDETSFV
ncbi:hypothetical protein [Roseiconus nitratireducens]|nr:hypothetical protein [Roseiconus nitratireducens]